MVYIVNSIFLLALLICGVVFYFILMASVLPKILKVHSAIRESSDRGLKKYIYPEGRGIVYEPHPVIRKYINRYALFTKDGYKLLKCKLDISVERLSYSVVMFDRRNRVIDVISVSEKYISNEETKSVTLHPRTSYIALVLESVNDECIDSRQIMCCKLWRLPIFMASVGTVSFLMMTIIVKVISQYDKWWLKIGLLNGLSVSDFMFPVCCLGIIAGIWAFLGIRAKGVRWVI